MVLNVLYKPERWSKLLHPTQGTLSINESYLVVLPFLGTQHEMPGTVHTLGSSGPFEKNQKPGPAQAGPAQAGPKHKGLLKDPQLGLREC